MHRFKQLRAEKEFVMLEAPAAQWSSRLQAEAGKGQACLGVRLEKQCGVREAPRR